MIVEIANSDDLSRLYIKYLELVAAEYEGPLEITFQAGTYGVASIGPIQLDLGGGNPAPKVPKIDVVLRGLQTDPPVVFRDMAMVVNARSLHLENLVVTGRRQGLLQARVVRAFSMRNCVVANNTWSSPWDGVLMKVIGTYDQPAYSVKLEDTWFVRNEEQSKSAALAILPATGSFVEQVEVARVAFVDGRTHSDLLVEEARLIRFDNVIAVKQHPESVVLRYARSKEVLFERSTFVVEDPLAIAAEDTRTWTSGFELRESQVYATGRERQLPAGIRGNVEILDRSLLRPRGGSLDELATWLATGVPDWATARARLRDVVGLER